MCTKAIFRLFRKKSTSNLDFYIKNGNIQLGSGTQVRNLSVYIQNPIANQLYISVGEQCILSGQILIYGEHATVNIGNRVFMGDDCKIFCRERVILQNDIMISWGCTLIDTNAHSLRSEERINDVTDWIKGPSHKNWDHVATMPIHIQHKCWIGFNSIITKGVTLAEGTVIGAGSVVSKSTESYGVYAGNPAILIKKTD